MSKHCIVSVFAGLAVVVLLPASVRAGGGAGFFAQYIGGSADWRGYLLTSSTDHGYGFGVVADTCIDDESFHNLRMSLAYGRMRMNSNRYAAYYAVTMMGDVLASESGIPRVPKPLYADRCRLEMVNSWALACTDHFRLWLGLLLDIGYDRVPVRYTELRALASWPAPNIFLPAYAQWIDRRARMYHMAGLGGGIALGLNVHVARTVSVFAQWGGIARFGYGGKDFPDNAITETDGDALLEAWFNGFEWYARFGALYRI